MKTQLSMSSARTMQTRRYRLQGRVQNGFTLVEILVVIAIIAILAAILLPVFNAARENSKQVNCASNLQQIGVAVKLYYQDEKKYPSSLAVLLPQDAKLFDSVAAAPPAVTAGTPDVNKQACDATTNAKTCPNTRGTGYLKSPKLLCPDDDTTSESPRASYGDISTDLSKGPPLAADAGRYVWNYWGYEGTGDNAGFAYTQATACGPTATPITGCLPPAYIEALTGGTTKTPTPNKSFLRDPTADYNATSNPIDLRKVPRMNNRYAPESTIITHCVYHRVPTSSNLAQPQDLYKAATVTDGSGVNSKDIVLRLSGAADLVDVTTWAADPTVPWVTQRK